MLIFDFGAEVYLWVGKGSAANPQMRKQGEKMAKDIFDNCYSAPSFDADLVFSKANSPTLNPNSLSLMTNRATGQKEQGLEGKATGLSSAGHTPKTGTPSPQRNPSDRQTNTPSTKVVSLTFKLVHRLIISLLYLSRTLQTAVKQQLVPLLPGGYPTLLLERR